MSMFILSENHFTSIKNALVNDMDGKDKNYDTNDLIYFIDESIERNYRKAVVLNYINALHLMNIECWNNKYNESVPMEFNEGASKPKKLNEAQLFTALTSLNYQLEEDYIDLDEADGADKYNALLFLRLLTGNVCKAYMRKSTSYANAGTWEIN